MQVKKLIVLAGDLILFYATLWLALVIRNSAMPNQALWDQHLGPFSLVAVAMVLIFYINRLYDLTLHPRRPAFYSHFFQALVATVVTAVILFYVAPTSFTTLQPQTVLALQMVLLGVSLIAWRWASHYQMSLTAAYHNVLFVGITPQVEELITYLHHQPQLGYNVAAVYAPQTQTIDLSPRILRYTPEDQLRDIVMRHNIATVVITPEFRLNPGVIDQLYQCLALHIRLVDFSLFYEQLTGKIPVHDIEPVWFLENLSENQKRFYEHGKRLVDVVCAVIGLVIGAVLTPLIALAIKMDSAGPLLFRQLRTGKNDQAFLAIKFRSMVTDAEQHGPQWSGPNDQRVTRVGRWLRKTRLDEIPQLWNVLRGEMSLIGPRPERPEFIGKLEQSIPYYRERLLVKPGLTGWAQVVGPAYGGSVAESLAKLQYDLYYIKNRSFGLDFIILLKTVYIVLQRKGQ